MSRQSYDFNIPETTITLQIPSKYVLLSPIDYAEFINNQEYDRADSEELKRSQIEYVNELQRDSILFIFVDSLNFNNQINLIKMYEYAYIDQLSAEMSLEEFKESLKTGNAQKIKKHTILEKKIVERVEYTYFKLKVKQTGDFGERLANTYVVSTKGKYNDKKNNYENRHSFTISFNNFDEKDYENLIRELSLK